MDNWENNNKDRSSIIQVDIDGVIHRHHVDQMLLSKAQIMITDKSNEEDAFLLIIILQHLNQHLSRLLTVILLKIKECVPQIV